MQWGNYDVSKEFRYHFDLIKKRKSWRNIMLHSKKQHKFNLMRTCPSWMGLWRRPDKMVPRIIKKSEPRRVLRIKSDSHHMSKSRLHNLSPSLQVLMSNFLILIQIKKNIVTCKAAWVKTFFQASCSDTSCKALVEKEIYYSRRKVENGKS